MGHHHRKDKPITQNEPIPTDNPNNFDFTSMLQNLNFDNVDLSKIDMNKVKSIMDRVKLPEGTTRNANSKNLNGFDARINLINSLKELMPTKRARTMDNISKFLQISQLLNNNMGISSRK